MSDAEFRSVVAGLAPGPVDALTPRPALASVAVLGAGPDHPQRPDFARSRYLKGALLAVD